jgi:O-antigen ligase
LSRIWPSLVGLLLAAVTFAAGGVYAWAWIPAALIVFGLALGIRPAIVADQRYRAIDVALIATLAAVLVQSIPLPSAALRPIDPHAASLRDALWLPANASTLSISILPQNTLAASGILAEAMLLFWVCRAICEKGGTGRIVRAIAIIGLLASITAVVQRAENKELLYGIWRPLDAGARPYGPFVNRNHFATWAIMAVPLIFGYLLARAPVSHRGQRLAQRFVTLAKQLGTIRVWLGASVCALALAVMISASRSGSIGLIAAFAASVWLSTRRQDRAARRLMVMQGVLLAMVVVSFASVDALVGRFDETLAAGSPVHGRPAIWRDAVRLAGDFRWTGTGAGTFGAAIGPYQTAAPGYTIGQAHNHYLQLAAEGGLMLSVPTALVLATFLLLFRRRLMDDHGPDYVIRAGAGAGIAGVMVQSFWETGLRMPANAMLLGVLAAIAIHVPASTRKPDR